MKVSQQEIDAAWSAWNTTGGTREETWKAVIKAFLKVRRARKAAKRERQRKEKETQKQYVIQTWAGKLIPDLSLEELEKAREYLSMQTLANIKDIAIYRQILCEINDRKEKDKQVVESVKPAPLLSPDDFVNPYDVLFRANIGSLFAIHGDNEPTPSKAPEWDGPFGVGVWEMRNGKKAVVSKISHYALIGNIQSKMRDWHPDGRFGGGLSQFDLIRPWPKGEQ